MTADWEKIKPIKINDNLILTYQPTFINVLDKRYRKKDIFIFKEYEVHFDNIRHCCNWPGILLKKKRIIKIDINKPKKIDLGYINKITLKYGEDFVESIDGTWSNHYDFKFVNKDTNKGDVTDNVFTLNFDDKKLSLFNGNNEDGYYSNDFIIYKNKKMIFKSSF